MKVPARYMSNEEYLFWRRYKMATKAGHSHESAREWALSDKMSMTPPVFEPLPPDPMVAEPIERDTDAPYLEHRGFGQYFIKYNGKEISGPHQGRSEGEIELRKYVSATLAVEEVPAPKE